MAISTRQQSLLVAEDWKKVYQTFRQADFQSYDFETLRKSMIDYLKIYQYEDFNDFIESSEYVALIDLIAFLGQSLAFRADLNARENFIDTAERRDSILRLAKLISYSPKRNIPATGYLKVQAISTTENITDAAGNNLSGTVINWADIANDSWQEQINAILNAAMVSPQKIGRPAAEITSGNLKYQQYQIRLGSTVAPKYSFEASVNGTLNNFEIVGTTIDSGALRETYPSVRGQFDLLYKNDGQGAKSANTGFFVKFSQGSLEGIDINITESLSNRVIPIEVNGINNTDVWLFDLDANLASSTLWRNVPAVASSNIVYNVTTDFTKKIYQVSSRDNDQIDLIFGDGNFAQIPVGGFRLYYRVSNGLTYRILPADIQRIPLTIDYVSRKNRVERLTMLVSLESTVTNASARETIADIRQRAPQQYYTQNRMVNGEDYNIFPYTSYANIVKSKAINRTSSGVSRFLDVVDVTGKYSTTNIFGDDGILYVDKTNKSFSFTGTETYEIENLISSELLAITNSKEMLHFYYTNAIRRTTDVVWKFSSYSTNKCTGFFRLPNRDQPQPIGVNYPTALQKGSLIKFVAPTGYYFDTSNNLIDATTALATGVYKSYIYATITTLIYDGTNFGLGNYLDGSGPVILNQYIPDGALVENYIAPWQSSFTSDVTAEIISKITAFKNFGLCLANGGSDWAVVDETTTITLTDAAYNIVTNPWVIKFNYINDAYTISSRSLKYIVESVLQTRFYFDNAIRVFDTKTGQLIVDQVRILKSNSRPGGTRPYLEDTVCFVNAAIIESDGYVDSTKIEVTYADSDSDGIPDNIEFFEELVYSTASEVNVEPMATMSSPVRNYYTKTFLTFYEKTTDEYQYVRWVPLEKGTVVILSTIPEIVTESAKYQSGQLFYCNADGKIYKSTNSVLAETTDYIAREGRAGLHFQYKHSSPGNRRIDPSPNNIIDLFLLTKQYDFDYRLWAQDTTNTVSKPTRPSPETLRNSFIGLEEYKMVSDTIIFNSAKYKPIFGHGAAENLQATFKVVKIDSSLASNAEIKASLIAALNTYFAVTNWDFGETFYFSELSAYLHTKLANMVSSIVIVPVNPNLNFGNLYQINAEPDEILISTATVDNVSIITALTSSQLNSIVV